MEYHAIVFLKEEDLMKKTMIENKFFNKFRF